VQRKGSYPSEDLVARQFRVHKELGERQQLLDRAIMED
jgi:hypothetical protein